MTTRKYDYTSLMRSIVRELSRHPRGMTSWELAEKALNYKEFSIQESSGRSLVKRVIKRANGILAERGYSIQYNYAMGVYQLGRNGTLVSQGVRVKKRQIRSRLLTVKIDLMSIANAHPEGTLEYREAISDMDMIDFLIKRVSVN